MRSEGGCVKNLYDEHEKTLSMIDRDIEYYHNRIDFQEEAKAHGVMLQARLETLAKMQDLLEKYSHWIDES